MKLHTLSYALLVALFSGCDVNSSNNNANNDVEMAIDIGAIEEITVGGVKFTLQRTSKNEGLLTAENLNAKRIDLHVSLLDENGNVLVALVEETFHGQDPITKRIPLNEDERLHFEVGVWKDGEDLLTCPFTKDSCFELREEKNVTIKKI